MKQCDICGKKPVSSFAVSHAHNRSKRRLLPNLQSVRALVDGQAVSMRVCTRCIRSNAVVKAPRNLGKPVEAAAK